ncbi:MAG: OmpA family protein, partial [Cytophagaceae bacterium]|nr:OmpA family protein [Cytophagaceae bacterium]
KKTEKKTSLKVQLLDANGNHPIEGKVIFESDSEKNSVPTTGSYAKLTVNTQGNMKIHAESHGYMPFMQMITLKQGEGNTLVVSLTKLEAGKSVTLNNVHFERGKFNLLEESFSELDKIVLMMKEYPAMEIELAGHTDNVGDPQKNVELSENRVKEVKNYLINKGIKASRIGGVGYGGSKPVASNASEDTRKLNRRVEFKILKME